MPVPNFKTGSLRTGLLIFALVVLAPAASAVVRAKNATLLPIPIPDEYGTVVFQERPDLPNQIYIVGQCHRSGVTGANHELTIQAQAEIFRIGEWLIRPLP